MCGTMLCITRRTISSRKSYAALNDVSDEIHLNNLYKDDHQSTMSTLAPTLLRSYPISSLYTDDPDMSSDDELDQSSSNRRVDLDSLTNVS
ncbi:hypothetical protein OGAPHI_006814 [Ogataea philodendri]|uniref:Uncharacterized protein n=1 Tax=Ogataea philodendri TaxID=1378263 RepID=A0A9P8NY91_9ASCO|nr:uncharacterized protein OGAPHI_006814 [Ogataea philodendri]KAH3661407.1 hypothetical protein OGAPHI_006814 [Ogataea philodendri]